MVTKHQLQTQALLDRGMKRIKDPVTGRFSVVDSGVDKTPLMLYTEGVTGMDIETILLKQMSTRRLAEWLSPQISRPITPATISLWRQRFKIKRVRR
tara:strand:+ start:1387 stop:1677 length:291 start_codon:yes stop_codon:yes gene_type:complete